MSVTAETGGYGPTMIIASIQTFPLRIPFRPGARSAAPARGPKDLAAADSLLVKVIIDQGCEGWGEVLRFAVVSLTQRAVDQLIARLCVGRDASRIASLIDPDSGVIHTYLQGRS